MKKVHLIPIIGSLVILLIILIILTTDFGSVATVEVKREDNRIVEFQEISREEYESALADQHDSAQEIVEEVQKKLE